MEFYDYIPGKQLNRNNLSSYFDSVVKDLDNQSAAYVLVANDVKSFSEDSSMKGNAIEGFQTLMTGYISALGALGYANEQDKLAVQNAKNMLGRLEADVYNGTEIVNNIKSADSDYKDACSNADWYRSKAKEADNILFKWAYDRGARDWDKKANSAWNEKKKWEGRARELINIDANLLGIFYDGKQTRILAQKGLEEINSAFDADTGVYSFPDMSWSEELEKKTVADALKPDGTVNWDLVNQILKKDADTISDYEYEILAYAYINADVSDLQHFFMQCGHEEDFYHIDRFVIDTKKINNIKKMTDVIGANWLAMEKSGKFSGDELDEIQENRYKAIQRSVLLDEFSKAGPFYGDFYSPTRGVTKHSDYFNFSETEFGFHNKDNGGNRGIQFTFTNMIYGEGRSIHPDSPCTIKISEPMENKYLSHYAERYSNKKISGLVPSALGAFGPDVIQFAVENGAGYLWKAGEKVIPIVGLAFSLYSDANEYLEQSTVVNSSIGVGEAAMVADDFGCVGVLVEKEGRYPYQNGFYLDLFEGKETQTRIKNYNHNAKTDVSDVLKNPGGVFNRVLEHMHNNTDIDDYDKMFTKYGYEGN